MVLIMLIEIAWHRFRGTMNPSGSRWRSGWRKGCGKGLKKEKPEMLIADKFGCDDERRDLAVNWGICFC